MQKTLLLSSLAVLAIILAGCGKTASNAVKTVDMARTANSINQNSQNVNKVDSEENIINIMKIMNYEGMNPDDNQKMHDAIQKGLADGKAQVEMNKELITASAKASNNLGTGYMLGYTFGCKAATGDETKCNKDIGKKYQEIFLEAFSSMASSSPQQ